MDRLLADVKICQRKLKFKQTVDFKRFLALNYLYSKLAFEIKDYNQIIGRYLDINFLVMNIIISYSIYLIFFVKMDPFFHVVVGSVLTCHSLSLFACIGACASITRSNNQMSQMAMKLCQITIGKGQQRFHFLQYDKVMFQNFPIKNRIQNLIFFLQIHTVFQNLSKQNVGFTLRSGYMITNHTYFTVS